VPAILAQTLIVKYKNDFDNVMKQILHNQSSGGKLRVPGKGSRKRLNQQVSVDSIDQWRNSNLTHTDLQVRTW